MNGLVYTGTKVHQIRRCKFVAISGMWYDKDMKTVVWGVGQFRTLIYPSTIRATGNVTFQYASFKSVVMNEGLGVVEDKSPFCLNIKRVHVPASVK